MSRVIFVSDVSPLSHGAFEHAATKIQYLAEGVGPVTVVRCGRDATLGRVLHEFRSKLRTTELIYCRLSPRTLGVLSALSVRDVPIVLEVNGYVLHDYRASNGAFKANALTRLLRRFLSKHRSSLLVGDEAYRSYVLKYLLDGDRSRWMGLPLVVPALGQAIAQGVYGEGSLSLGNTLTFAGSLSPWQGVEDLVRAFQGVAPRGWRLDMYGLGEPSEELKDLLSRRPPEMVAGMSLLRPLVGEEFATVLMQSGVLCAPYRLGRLPGVQDEFVSSLKSLTYLMTDRPVILSSRDSILMDLDQPALQAGIFLRGESERSLVEAITAAVGEASAGKRYSDRGEAILRLRGHDAVRAKFDEILARMVARDLKPAL